MKNPPSGVKLVMAAVCVMKDIKPEKISDPYENMMSTKNISNKIFLHTYTKFVYNDIPSPNMESILKTLI